MDQSHTIYLNNAATSFPKPKRVIEAISRSLLLPPSEPGRSHQQQDPTLPCRKRLALLFHVPTPSQVILTPSATIALNLVITGYLRQSPGGNCVTTRLEHNSVIRPLEHGSQRFGTRITYVSPEKNGRVLPATIQSSIDSNTRLICSHSCFECNRLHPTGRGNSRNRQRRTKFLF